MKIPILKAGVVGALLAVALGAGVTTVDASNDSGETIIELRIWQHVDDAEDVWVSARQQGGDWDTLGTVPLEFDGFASGGLFRTGDLSVAGVEVRIWQSTHDPALLRTRPERISVRACGAACPEHDPRNPNFWRPLGMLPVTLDDDFSRRGRYRYGDLVVAIPRDNPGLLADREYLLASREALEGPRGAALDWSAATPTSEWGEVVVEGTPARVTKLLLSDRGLQGAVWGWLGNLTELTELRLDGNELRGVIPSKLAQLAKLTHLYLGGYGLGPCLPPPLRWVPNNDFARFDLRPDCPAPPVASYLYFAGGFSVSGAGTYQIRESGLSSIVFDVPGDWWLRIQTIEQDDMFESDFAVSEPIHRYRGVRLSPVDMGGAWLFIHPATGLEYDRFYGDDASTLYAREWREEIISQVAASIWVDTTGILESEWR